jgi:Domain of unknown function (DUF4188)
MGTVHNGRYTARIDGDFVVFLIGMRFNRPLKVWQWGPVFAAMPRMLRELAQQEDRGLLGVHTWFGRTAILLQYWRSFADLERFARDPDTAHLPAWREFNRRIGASGDVGIWHETYHVRAGEYEVIYGNMPRFGLAAAAEHVPIGRVGHSAGRRIGARTTDDEPVPRY